MSFTHAKMHFNIVHHLIYTINRIIIPLLSLRINSIWTQPIIMQCKLISFAFYLPRFKRFNTTQGVADITIIATRGNKTKTSVLEMNIPHAKLLLSMHNPIDFTLISPFCLTLYIIRIIDCNLSCQVYFRRVLTQVFSVCHWSCDINLSSKSHNKKYLFTPKTEKPLCFVF